MAATGENRWPPVGRTRWPLTRISQPAPASAIAASGVWQTSVPLLEGPPCKPSLQPAVRRSTDDIKADSGDETVDREAETFDGKAKVQCFRGPPPRSWRENESAVPAVFPRHKAQALQTKVRPRPPTAVSNPTKTKRSQKSNAASSRTGVRPRPTLRSHIPTSLI